MPSSLSLTDEEIVHPPDVALYRLLEKGLEERVREAEQSAGLKLWCGERGPSYAALHKVDSSGVQ